MFVDTGDVVGRPASSRACSRSPSGSAGPGGCPWDAAQTHHSLRRHVLEEAYEVVAAIDELPADAPGGEIPLGAYDALEDELGDLLFQVMIHSVLASEAGAFTDRRRGARRAHQARAPPPARVRRRSRPTRADAVVTNWEQIKKDEKGHESLVEGITPGLPSLIYAQKLLRKARVDRARTRSRRRIRVARRAAVGDEDALGAALAALAAAGARARLRRRVGAERVGGPVQGPLRPDGGARASPSRSTSPPPMPRSCASSGTARGVGPRGA